MFSFYLKVYKKITYQKAKFRKSYSEVRVFTSVRFEVGATVECLNSLECKKRGFYLAG